MEPQYMAVGAFLLVLGFVLILIAPEVAAAFEAPVYGSVNVTLYVMVGGGFLAPIGAGMLAYGVGLNESPK